MPETTITNPTTTHQWAAQLLAERRTDPRGLRPADIHLLDTQVAALMNQPDTSTGTSVDNLGPTIVRTRDKLGEVAQAINSQPVAAIDLETSSLDPASGEIVGIGLAIPAQAFYVPTAHRIEESNTLLPDQLPLLDVAAAIDFREVPFIAHNAKYELKWLQHHLGVTPRFVWDTMLAARLLRSDLPAGLKVVVLRELDVPDWSLTPGELGVIQFLAVDRVARYCGHDAAYTLQLYERQQRCLV